MSLWKKKSLSVCLPDIFWKCRRTRLRSNDLVKILWSILYKIQNPMKAGRMMIRTINTRHLATNWRWNTRMWWKKGKSSKSERWRRTNVLGVESLRSNHMHALLSWWTKKNKKLSIIVSFFGQRPQRGRWPMLSHMGKFFLLLLLLLVRTPPPSAPTSRPISQPRGPCPSLEAQIPVLRPKSQPQSQNPISRSKSHLRGSNPGLEAKIPLLRPRS